MFRLRPDGPPAAVEVLVEGRRVLVPEGAAAAAAALLAGLGHIRETPVTGARRSPYCLMGVCFECLVEIDGRPNRQSCMIAARPGMRIHRQLRARTTDAESPHPNPPPPAGEGRFNHPPLQAGEGEVGVAALRADLAIVGAGPAGMAAAVEAAGLGIDTVLIDEQDHPGGQIWRGLAIGGCDPDADGEALLAALRASGVRHLAGTAVWHIEDDGTLWLAHGGATQMLAARHILLATGAIERPVPLSGWTLPGVMGVGAAQVLLKTAGIVPEGRAVLAGQGPLVWLFAAQLTRAGAPPAAILETTPAANPLAALRETGGLWRGRRMLWRGLQLIGEARRAVIPVRHGIAGLRAAGTGRVERVEWAGGGLAADHLLLHEGVIPNVQISLALQLQHDWDPRQLSWRPAVDEWGRSSRPNIRVAGDGAGIAGAVAAVLSGRLAALGVAAELGRIGTAERDRRAAPLRRALVRERALRPFLDALYRPPPAILAPADDVLACRCEEVTAGRVRAAARLGAIGPNQLKAYTRCGMGPCQGRICGPVVAALIADALGRPVAEVGTLRPRAPFKPITLGALAGLEMAETVG